MLCAVFLTGCSTKTVTEYLVVRVDEDLRRPCLVAERPYESIADVGILLTDHVECLDTANGRIIAIDDTLKRAEAQIEAGPQ